MTEMVTRFYKPKGYITDGISLKVTKEQAEALDKLWNKKEIDAYFWAKYVNKLNNNNPNVARIKGEHFVIGEENSPSFFRGFGGHCFKIRFFDGREVTTTNLWHQGTIPEELKDILIDNAEFVEGEEVIMEILEL